MTSFLMPDDRVIVRHHPYEVHAEQHEVMWRDGSTAVLHPVFAHRMPMLMLRALALEPGRWRLFDLSSLHRPFDIELRQSHPRDVAGFVFYELRQQYITAGGFTAHVAARCLGTWTADGPDGACTWTPRREESSADVAALLKHGLAPRGPRSEGLAA